jgi:hypothetical protein
MMRVKGYPCGEKSEAVELIEYRPSVGSSPAR